MRARTSDIPGNTLKKKIPRRFSGSQKNDVHMSEPKNGDHEKWGMWSSNYRWAPGRYMDPGVRTSVPKNSKYSSFYQAKNWFLLCRSPKIPRLSLTRPRISRSSKFEQTRNLSRSSKMEGKMDVSPLLGVFSVEKWGKSVPRQK